MSREFKITAFAAVASGTSAGVLLWQFGPPKESQSLAILSAGISLASIGLGFLGTACALLMSMKDSRALRALRELPQWSTLVTLLMHGMASCFVLAVLSALLIVVPAGSQRLLLGLGVAWAAALAYSGVATALIAHIFAVLLKL